MKVYICQSKVIIVLFLLLFFHKNEQKLLQFRSQVLNMWPVGQIAQNCPVGPSQRWRGTGLCCPSPLGFTHPLWPPNGKQNPYTVHAGIEFDIPDLDTSNCQWPLVQKLDAF